MAALNHPNILAVHDIGTYEDAPYIVSEILMAGRCRTFGARRTRATQRRCARSPSQRGSPPRDKDRPPGHQARMSSSRTMVWSRLSISGWPNFASHCRAAITVRQSAESPIPQA